MKIHPGQEGSESTTSFNPMNYRANESPNWRVALFLGFQQTMVCLSGILVIPNIVSDLACAGSDTIELRARLIASTLMVTGITTLIQTTLGLRLSILQGPSFAFIPPLLAFSRLNECRAKLTDIVPEEDYLNRIRVISGSLFLASVCLTLLGATGLIGVISKRIGPLTVAPLVILLCIGNVPLVIEKARLHWLSLIQFSVLLLFAFFLSEVSCKLPYLTRHGLKFCRYRLFGNFPYLLSIMITWLIAVLLTVTNIEPKESVARVDRNQSVEALVNSPWFQAPYPGQFGMPTINLGLFLGFLTSCMACSTESLGAYCTLAKVSAEKKAPPSRTLNRAILVEGVGCCLSALLGCGVGITTYSENVAVVAITRVASRFVMQVAAMMLILLGMFTKFAVILASCPEPLIGGILAMSVALICSVGFTNLQSVDLKVSRNLSILGLGVILGIAIPEYVEQAHIDVGVKPLNEMLQILLTTRMFVGGLIAFILDNISGGVTPEQRGLPPAVNEELNDKYDGCGTVEDGYSFSERGREMAKKQSNTALDFRTDERPSFSTALLMGFQHIMVSLSGMLVIGYLVSDFVCSSGEAKVELRARLISATIIISGFITFVQTTFGLRLSVLQGPAFAFVPPLLSFSRLPDMRCEGNDIDYIQRLQIIAGSVAASGLIQLLLGGTGLIGIISKRVGPLTITPLMILLCVGNCQIVLEKAALHWISSVQFLFLFILIFFMADIEIPIPVVEDKKLKIIRVQIFKMFPYLIGISLTWLIAFVLTKYDVIPEGNPARTDNPSALNVLRTTPWFQIPYPVGTPSFSLGLFLGCLTSCVAASVESLGAYKTLSKVSQEAYPSASSINRATLFQGLGCSIFGLFGCGVGATVYSENIAIIPIVRNASRSVMQIAGVLLIVVGLFTKLSGVLAMIPDPMIGGVFGISVCLVCGICLSNLQSVNLESTRNLTTLGFAIILGIVIPNYVERYPIDSGIKSLDQTLNILLTTRMFLGGAIGFLLDNLSESPLLDESVEDEEEKFKRGYSFPLCINRWLLSKTRFLQLFPFMPTKKELVSSIKHQEEEELKEVPESDSLLKQDA